jgi:hypothetical protein
LTVASFHISRQFKRDGGTSSLRSRRRSFDSRREALSRMVVADAVVMWISAS